MSEAPLKATLKAGRDFDAPWLTVDGDNANDLLDRLTEIKKTTLLEALVDTANTLKAVNSAAPIAADVASPPVAPQQAALQPTWSQPQAAAPAWAGQQQAAPVTTGNHPAEGTPCPACNAPIAYRSGVSKRTQKPYSLVTCPNQRAKDDGHFSLFL